MLLQQGAETVKKSDVSSWREVGRAAYHAGHPAIPAFDPKVMAAIGPLSIGGGAVPLMRTWLDGWLTAHLAESTW